MYYDKKLYSGYTSYLYIIWIPYIEPSGPESDRGRSPSGVPAPGVAGWDCWEADSGTMRRERPELKGEMTARDRTIRTIQIRVRSEFLESKENHEKPLHRNGIITTQNTRRGRRKGKRTALRKRGGLRSRTNSKDAMRAFKRCSFKIQEFSLEISTNLKNFNIF